MDAVWYVTLIPIGIMLAFYVWMFREMANDETLPPGKYQDFAWPPVSQADWFLIFVILNVFGAVLYYSTRYRNRRDL